MQSQPQEQSHRLRVEDEFRQHLLSKWTCPVACQNECRPEDACRCQRKIVHVKALEKYWNEPLTDSPDQTKGHRFLDEMDLAPHHTFPPVYQDIFTGEQCCPRVLSLLLQQGRGSLIDLFHSGAMYDKYLMRGENHQTLRDSLRKKMKQEEVDSIVEDFHRDKWAYCPMELTLGMTFNAHGTKVIPPFCSKIKLPDKGGTASIYWVAVQKDLISDPLLASTLLNSLYHDEKYGECYQMILKSYAGNKESVFDLEKQAFAGLNSKKDVPILQYLGSYTHDYGEGEDMGKTYNILLEYGDNDLYQAWADETNVPPVRAEEILQTWNALFEIAKAIRHVHRLEVPRGGGGEPRRFHGWHADIKPDNILSIRGRLKLSDFGFSSFAPVIREHARSAPTEFIKGFTDTYGAPEVFQMKGQDGTLSGVTQSIDIWSFGCVLSVAATWIVLGFQGIRQYQQLRQLATSNCQDGKHQHDRFHDGKYALPEIRKWHDYLRGHLRPSDTTTELVLTLIENRLLRGDPSQRPDSERLCNELQILHKRAQREIQDLPQHLRVTDAAVLRALSKIEEKAHSQRDPEARTNPELRVQPIMPTGASQVNPRKWASMQLQLQKDDMINNRLLGQTPYRKDILRQELRESTVQLPGNDEHAVYNVHNGDFTQSPAHSTPVHDMPISSPPLGRMTPQFPKADQQECNKKRSEIDNDIFGQTATPKTPKNHQHRHEPRSDDERDWIASFGSYAMPHLRKSGHTMENTSGVTFKRDTPTSRQMAPKKPLTPSVTLPVPLSPPYTPGTRNFSYDMLPRQSSLVPNPTRNDETPSRIPELASPNFKDSVYGSEQVYNPVGPAGLRPGLTSTFNTTSPLEPFNSPIEKEDMEAYCSAAHVRSAQPVEIQGSTTSPESSHMVQGLPPSVLDLPYSICQKRQKLEQEKPGKMGKLTNMLTGKEDRKADPNLRDISSDRRELVFVIDNGRTMSRHWPILTFVVETLAMTAAGIDKSGIDFRFTVDGNSHNADNIVGNNGRKVLRKRLEDAWPEYRQTNNGTSDMVAVFQKVYEEWEAKNRPATTLYVFTDGKWARENPAVLDERIIGFAQQDRRGTGKRHFSIQFIRFGDDEIDKKQLQWLDDSLCSRLGLRDIIDHCSWRASVDKIFKGSIEGFHDEKDDDEDPISYNYKELVEKFANFNKGGESWENRVKSPGLLSPSTSSLLHRSPSQLSSASAQRKRDSTHPETPDRHSKRFSRSSLFLS